MQVSELVLGLVDGFERQGVRIVGVRGRGGLILLVLPPRGILLVQSGKVCFLGSSGRWVRFRGIFLVISGDSARLRQKFLTTEVTDS